MDFKFAEVLEINLKDTDVKNPYQIKARLHKFNSGNNAHDIITANPLNFNIKNIPVIGEIVVIIRAPASDSSGNVASSDLYYITSVNLQNSINHNALFHSTKLTVKKSDYNTASAGIPTGLNERKKLGDSFEEKRLSNLQLFEGDIAFEGRFGQTLRLGSTVKGSNFSKKPSWTKSISAANGSPIIILANSDKHKTVGKYHVEDINKDQSSIYLTSGQKLDLKEASNKLSSHTKPPSSVSGYSDPQSVITSDRIILNAKSDGVFCFAKKFVSLSSGGTMNIDSTGNFIVDSPKIYLGSKRASEPILFGNKTTDWLSTLTDIVSALLNDYIIHYHLSPIGVPTAPALPPTPVQMPIQISKLVALKAQLSLLKSRRNYTL